MTLNRFFMKKNILLLLIALFTSCIHKTTANDQSRIDTGLMEITENENKGIKEILSLYGGECSYTKGISSANGQNVRYFKLEITKSRAIEKDSNIVGRPASNIAYIFYTNLVKEKTEYDEIRVSILLKNGTSTNVAYSMDTLEVVKNKMIIADGIVALIKSKKYSILKTRLKQDDSYIKYDKDKLIDTFIEADPICGNVIEFRQVGFDFLDLPSGNKMIHISGYIIRDIKNNAFSVDINANKDSDQIFICQYKL
jgi:hypothetical protein